MGLGGQALSELNIALSTCSGTGEGHRPGYERGHLCMCVVRRDDRSELYLTDDRRVVGLRRASHSTPWRQDRPDMSVRHVCINSELVTMTVGTGAHGGSLFVEYRWPL